jgi:hypothetical protein
VSDEEAIASLIGAVTDGDVTDLEDAEKFLGGFGISKKAAREIIGGLIEKNKEFSEVLPMAKSNLWETAAERLSKALGKKKSKEDDVDPDELDQETDDDDDDDDDGDDEEGYEDAAPVLKAMSEKITKLETSNEVMQEALASLVEQSTRSESLQKAIGESLYAVMERTEQIAASPAPRKAAISSLEALQAAMAKGGFGGGAPSVAGSTGAGVVRNGLFTSSDMDEAKDILSKAVSEGKLTLQEVARAEGQLNKAMQSASTPIDQKFINILRGSAKE